MEFESHCAHQPEYTLPCPLEVYQQPLKYRYLHITDTQRRPQWCPLLHCVHLELHFARYLLTVLFRASAHGCSQLKRQKLRVGDCAEGLKWFNYPLASAHPGCKVSCQGGTELTCIVSLSVLRRSQPDTYIACCQISTAFSCRLQYANFMLQGKNAVNEATEGVCKPDVVVPKAHQKNHRYVSLAELPSDSLCKGLALWMTIRKTSTNNKTLKIGEWALARVWALARDNTVTSSFCVVPESSIPLTQQLAAYW